MRRAAAMVAAVAGLGLASKALACMPGCSGYHLTFTGPVGAAAADQSVTVTWSDTVDGATATFDLMASAAPVPVYPMHSFPAELPGQLLALDLPASSTGPLTPSWTWDTSDLAAGTYFLYAVFHNSPFNTLVMPFAAVAVAHGGTVATPVAIIRSPRGVNPASGLVQVALDAAASSDASVDVYVGSPPDAADGRLVATVPAGLGQTVSWDSSAAANGSYVFKAVLRDPTGTLATAYSPGEAQVGPVSTGSGCTTGLGATSWLPLLLLQLLLLRKAAQLRSGVTAARNPAGLSLVLRS